MPRRDKHIVGLDVGTTKVCAVIGEPADNGALEIIGVGLADSEGQRKGVVVDVEATVQSIKNAVEEAERRLAVSIAGFNDTLAAVATEGMPHLLCGYVYELASRFTTFYEACPVLKSAPDVRASRLRLCDLTARTLKTGLGILGIEVPERM